MKKITKNKGFLVFFVLVLFAFVNSCIPSQKLEKKEEKKCEYSPDFEKIGESVMDSLDDMKRIELMSYKMRCNF